MILNNVYYVYEWFVNETNEVFYVGKGKDNRYKSLNRRNKFFKDFYNTHNCSVKKIKENLSEQLAFDLEKRTIKFYREKHPEYRLTNMTDGGDGSSGYKHSKESKKKISSSVKANWNNKDFYNKMLKIKQDCNGVYKSKDFRDKISKIVSGKNNPNYNNRWTDEQKEHLSFVRKSSGIAKGINNPKSKSIICIETGEIFDLIKNSLIKYNIKDESSMSIALDNKNRTCAKMHWITFDKDKTSKEYRYKYLIECFISSKKFTPYIDLKTLKLYKNEKDLLIDINVGKKYFKKYIENKSERYIKLKDYYGRIYQ